MHLKAIVVSTVPGKRLRALVVGMTKTHIKLRYAPGRYGRWRPIEEIKRLYRVV